ncbi:hypothetical protein PsorP6_017657 [Peronosclerospora sorghi]|uniref:Uncharacterized protein n=1 Tax=Peronosclerospora sorghi TaxID=230839 RepID=A0ACC0WKH8_9STRA|nr:hypothetical protein PsorP6_017657 [Peronosclerospora sorghi]
MATKTMENVVKSVSDAVHPPPPKAVASRKRIFTFQKRWLHTLPIIERSLSETEVNARVLKSVCASGRASSASVPGGDEMKQDVIVCMLCEEPASKRELTKVWSRSNCRRGRIENHLMSKHPEFMRLLRYKREAEGDLAVQIFLQSLRDGRCNARTEINHGLYSQLSAECAARASSSGGELMKRELRGEYAHLRDLRQDVAESHRKRLKVEETAPSAKPLPTMTPAVYSAENANALAPFDPCQVAVLFPQWQTIFFNKLVVVTGGDNKAVASVATQLWLLGANVLITFTTLSAMDAFNTKHNSRFPDSTESEENPRGIMLPVVVSFRSKKEITDWCNTIALKYQRVDFLLNYVGPDLVDSISSKDLRSGLPKNELMVSSVYRAPVSFALGDAVMTLIEALNESMSSCCFPDPTAADDGWQHQASNGTIVNVVAAEDDLVIESLVKQVAVKLQPRNIQVNCVLLPWRHDGACFQDATTLSHSILFLLSPFSRLLSGSVLRVQQIETSSSTSASARRKSNT